MLTLRRGATPGLWCYRRIVRPVFDGLRSSKVDGQKIHDWRTGQGLGWYACTAAGVLSGSGLARPGGGGGNDQCGVGSTSAATEKVTCSAAVLGMNAIGVNIRREKKSPSIDLVL